MLTHVLLFAAAARRARVPHIIYSRQEVLRTTLCGHVVLGARIASALWVSRCWRAVGREQPMHPGDRSRRWLVRPLFVPYSVDADFLLLLWEIYLWPRFGGFFGRRNLSTLLWVGWRALCERERIKAVYAYAAAGPDAWFIPCPCFFPTSICGCANFSRLLHTNIHLGSSH